MKKEDIMKLCGLANAGIYEGVISSLSPYKENMIEVLLIFKEEDKRDFYIEYLNCGKPDKMNEYETSPGCVSYCAYWYLSLR